MYFVCHDKYKVNFQFQFSIPIFRRLAVRFSYFQKPKLFAFGRPYVEGSSGRSRPWPLPGVQDLPEPRRAPAARARHAGRPGDVREGLGMAGRIPGTRLNAHDCG